MSNKITLATIQFRADTKGVNPALDAMRQSAKDAHDEMDRMQEALDKGIKRMKNANGVEFDVADRLKAATKEARSFDQAVRELVKGATALETVVQNIRLGEIEKSSRAELKGAINAAEARKRSVRETDPEDLQQQRELNQVIEESRKQLNNLDRDTQKVIETLDKGGIVAQATLDKEIKGLKEILTLIPKGTDEWNKYNQQLTQMEAHVASIRRQEREAAVSLLGSKDFGRYSEEEIRTAITNARELLATYKTASPEAKALADNIVRADQYLKEHGIEAAKESAKQQQTIKQERQLHMLMNARLKDLTTLSADALEETRKYWQAQQDGAEASSYAFRKAKKSLQEINAEQDARNRKQLTRTAGRLKQQDLSTLSEDELNQAIKAGKELVALMKPADKGYQQLIDNIIRAEKHVKEFGLEGERSNRKAAEQMQIMVDRMARLSSLSDGALQETRKFWQEQMDGAERGSDAYKEAAKNLKAIADEQTRLTNEQNKTQATRLLNKGNLQTMSEGEIRKSIEAAKAYQQTLSSSDAMYQRLSVAIVDAEEHIKEYGIESERTARKEAAAQKLLDDKHRMMQDRMQNLQNLSEGGLAETKKYWQAQMDGAERSSRAFKEAEKNLKAINAEQQRLANDQMQKSARRLNRRDLSTMSEQELTESVKAAKQLLANMKPTETDFKQLQDNIIRAEKHIKEFGLESERSLKAAEEQTRLMNSRMKNLKTLSADALEETRKYWQAQRDGADAGSKEFEKAEKNLKRIDNLIGKRKVKALDEILGDPQHHGISEVEQAVKEMERLRDSVQKGVPAWQHYNKMVNQGRDYLDQLAKTEAADRVAAQMKNLSQLSKAGLDEVKRYWQAQIDGATRGSQAYKDAEAAMKRITNLEQTRQAGQATRVLYRPDRYGDAEIRQAIQTMEQLRDAQAHGSQKWEMYNKRVQEGKQYLEEWAQLDNVIKFEGQMQKLPQLSDAALAETKKFWETMVAGAEKGSQELTQYEAHLERVKQEERDRRQLNDEITAQRLNGNLKTQSEQEIREAIEAAKRLIQTYESAGPEAAALSVKIADAEEHLKKYGLEAERAARREAKAIADAAQKRQESDDLMKQQLQQGASLSKEALRAQEQYWKKLIDDPKTAAASLQDYQQQLDKVRMLQELMMQQRGTDALDRMRNDVDYERKVSPNQIKEDIEAIKALRNSLPQEGNEDVLREIDYYLTQLEGSAKKATQEVMSLDDALELAKKAGDWKGDGFFATPQSIQAATKAIEKERDSVIQLIQQKRNLGQATKAEEDQLADLTKKLRSLKFEQDNVNMSQEKMRTLIETPANAVNLDELRAAIKRADGQLRQMEQSLGQNSDEYKRFAEQVRNAKNVMKEMEGQAKASATAWEKAFSRLKTYVVMYMGFNEVWQKVSNTARDLMDLSDRMGEVGKTTQMTAEQVGRLTDRLRDLDTRTSLVALTELSAKAGQLGLKTEEDILGFTEAANKMLVALPEMGADGATQMMKVALATGEVNRIKKEMDQGLIEGSSATAVAMEKIASTIDQLRANSAAAAPQITDFVKRVGAVGAQSGISIDQVAALGSTVDALGMRVEMSATALSRMIPAIRNNAFEVAKAIGMAPEALRKMFDEAGGGMNAMLAIFQHIKDAGMNPDDIEKMLGMGGMRDIMKDLNQQGARAGIVFAGLSQNVDVLRQHLGIASEAYEENVAIQQEYDRMSETTAAKWERLKNQFEEMWVGTSANNALGGVIDALRVIVDLISGPLNTAFNSAVVSIVAIKSGLTSIPAAAGSVFDYLKESAQKAALDLEKAANATDAISDAAAGVGEAADVVGDIGDALSDAKEAGEQAGEAVESATGAISGMGAASKVSIFSINGLKTAWKGLDTTMKANIIVAVIALLYTLGKAIYDIVTSVDAEKKALAEANQEADRATEKLGVYFDHLKDTTAELDAAKKATEGLTAGTDKATEAEIRMTKATDNHRTAIANINQNYSKYLGFMLTEYDRAEMVAAAHNKIAAAIRREILMKQKQASIEENEKKHQDDLSDDWAKIVSQMTEDDRMTGDQAASARLAFRKMLSKSYTTNANGDLVASDTLKKSLGSLYNDNASLEQLTAVWMARHLQQNYGLSRNAIKDITGIDYYKSDYGTSKGRYIWTTSKEPFGNNLRGDYLGEYFDMQRENAKTGRLYQEDLGATEEDLKESTTTIVGQLKDNINAQISLLRQSNLSAKERNDAYAELARALEGVNENVDELETAEQKQTKQFVTDVLEKNKKFIDSSRLQRARDKIQQGFDAFSTLDTETNNIWGNRLPAESTDWKNMTAEQLVNRRKQMADFVNAIQTDTDVKAVLEEDKALKKAIEAGMSSDMRTVIEWYNTERLKIQDELHARHLTNTGDWLDLKKERGAKKQFRDEMDAYLHELDAYYTERKTRIEQARNDEEITEGEAWRRTIQNDNEWQTRRAELQKLYSRKQQEVTKEELDAIIRIIAERTGDSEAFVKAAIAKTNQFVDAIEKSGDKGAAIVHRWMSQVVLDTERSYLKAAQAIGKQMKFIEDTLAKERPYDGITKNLQDNLDKMGVLAAKYRRENEELARQGKEPKYSNEQITAQSYDEMAFYLRQAADAYSIDIDELLRRMVKEGMTATAEEISKSDMLKQAVMGQLRKTYQEVQDAVKKEASQIKKDVEIIWNDDARGIGGMSMKATFDKALAQLGMQQDSVSRANSLIGAGAASDNVASRLAMKQIEVQMRMQKAQYDMYRVQTNQRMAALKAEAEEHRKLAKLAEQKNDIVKAGDELLKATNAERDAENVRLSLGLTLAEETKEQEQQKAELLKIQEESQNRLYTSLREWADLLTSSLQGVMEASHAGDAEYYNERAKLDLTGKGGPGAGTYVVIDDAGTSDATAHYEYLDERQALERQHEIEIQNAQAEAWRKLMDDLNMKMSETITDQINALLQNQSIDANTQAVIANTQALWAQVGQGASTGFTDASQLKRDENGFALDGSGQIIAPIQPTEPAQTEQPTSYWPIGDTEQKPIWTVTDPANTAATDANTQAVNANAQAVNALTQKLDGQAPAASTPADVPATPAPAPAGGETTDGVFLQKPFFQMTEEEKAQAMTAIGELWQAYNEGGVEAMTQMAASLAEIPGVVLPPWQIREDELEAVMERMGTLWQSYAEQGIEALQQMSDAMAEMPNKIPDPTQLTEEHVETATQNAANMYNSVANANISASNRATDAILANQQKIKQGENQTSKQMTQSTGNMFAKMTQAANLYGIAYQAMSNDNLSTEQKFQMIALQTAGQTAIAMLTTNWSKDQSQVAGSLPAILAECLKIHPIAGAAIFAVLTGVLGGLMGVAASKIGKHKSEISQATGASVSAGRLATGMLTYKTGNVNELTDPASLTPGRQYNVDGADGKTYRARYMGKGAKTHITNGPEFHLVGEAGREAIIDAKTTRLLQMDDTGIWRDIQTLYNGGSISGLSSRRRRGTGVAAFADGNIGEFEDALGGEAPSTVAGGMGMEQMLTALDRNSAIQEALLERLNQPIVARNIWTGPEGIPNMYNKMQKEAQRHGEKYL